MAIVARLAGEGIGPFRTFDFDFSDISGLPHPGPHIFAGINGSGKSSVLRTLAWLWERRASDGFQWQQWEHLVDGHECTRAMMVVVLQNLPPFVVAKTMDTSEGWAERLHAWVEGLLASGKVDSLKGELSIQHKRVWPERLRGGFENRKRRGTLRLGGVITQMADLGTRVLPVGYGPSRLLRYLANVDLSVRLEDFREASLSFESTVQNEAVQSWLLGLFSKRAIARERSEISSTYSATLARFETALELMCDQKVQFDVDIEPLLQPRLLMYQRRLDFSQLPDGVRSTVGWLADFLMRMDAQRGQPVEGLDSVLFLDEVDAHLHPKWQRSILPSIKQALPDVQVFATSHSPFVIASCPGARVHVLELDNDGHASNRPAEDAPVGESILATMKDIFGVNSRFDVETERLLEEWNDLRRKSSAGTLSKDLFNRFDKLTHDLGERGEELRQIVAPSFKLNDSLMAALQSDSISSKAKNDREG
jgi:hypothetical protein